LELYAQTIFLASFAGQGVLNKDLTIWQDGARPANICSLPSFSGTQPRSHMMYPPPKFIAQSNTFGGIGDFLSPNVLDVKNVITNI
jgi:hypothetical protein